MQIIALILTALGAIGGIIWVARTGKNYLRRRQLKKRLKPVSKDFFYKKLEIGAKVSKNGTEWETTRKATIVSLVDKLNHIQIGVRRHNKENGEHSCSLSPDTLKLAPSGISGEGFELFHITPDAALCCDEELSFIFRSNFLKKQDKDLGKDCLLWRSAIKVDELCLRVVFADNIPKKLMAQILDLSSNVLDEKQLSQDLLTGEFHWSVPSPVSNLVYTLAWDIHQ